MDDIRAVMDAADRPASRATRASPLVRAGIAEPGPRALALTELSRPTIDWVSLAAGLGVPGRRAETADAFVTALERALSEPGPALIEAIL